MNIFCNNCEDKSETKDLEVVTLKNGKRGIKGICVICNSKKILLLGKEGGKLFVGELHLPLHNYTGPGTRLDLRTTTDPLTGEITPKDWSIPINKVDEASLKHDIKYIDKNLEARHKADTEMIEELNNIEHPTFRERLERNVVIPILKIKKWLGLGIIPPDLRDIF